MRLFALIIFLSLLNFACGNNDSEISVKNYVISLKNGSYNSNSLPDFKSNDITELLNYCNDTTLLKTFPVNPISSRANTRPTLGLFALWTIESVRKKELGDFINPGRFPSLDPMIFSRTGKDLQLIDKVTIQSEVADAYSMWWNDRSISDNQKLKSDPLEDTDYRW